MGMADVHTVYIFLFGFSALNRRGLNFHREELGISNREEVIATIKTDPRAKGQANNVSRRRQGFSRISAKSTVPLKQDIGRARSESHGLRSCEF